MLSSAAPPPRPVRQLLLSVLLLLLLLLLSPLVLTMTPRARLHHCHRPLALLPVLAVAAMAQ